MIRIITSLVAVFTVASVQSQTSSNQAPKMFIGITIDQLRGDYLELFQHTFGEKGFKRLFNEGTVYQDVDFGFSNLDAASAIATIYTGSTPFYHGIVSEKQYSTKKKAERSIYEDDNYLGNYTSDKLSPKKLRVSTVGDELKIASLGSSSVYVFAQDPEQALSAAGHSANCAYWIESVLGKWATTTYYKDTHWIVDQENRNNIYSNQVENLSWKPLMTISHYNAFPYTTNRTSFQHSFARGAESFDLIKHSPYYNENVRVTAEKLIEKAELGKRMQPDFLALTFYAGNYTRAVDKKYSLEIQDIYARLDNELGLFFDYIDKNIGLKNVAFVVTSTGYYESENAASYSQDMPDHKFYTDRCEALLNMYLMAIYGKKQWVDGYSNNQIFLNRELIEKDNINLQEIQEKTADFVFKFTGVQDVATADQILRGTASPEMNRYRDAINKDSSGDVFIEIQPGYQIVRENKALEKTTKEVIVSPVIFFGYNAKPQKINRTIKATEIAPTISHILRIRSPNAAKEKVLPELIQLH